MKKVIATSATKEGIRKLISEYYMGSNITLKGELPFEVHNSKGLISSVHVANKRGRFVFERK